MSRSQNFEAAIQILKRHKKIWKRKKILQKIYLDWYQKIINDLVSGKTLEIGSGAGYFKKIKPEIISSDIVRCPWLDMCFDAHKIPFPDNSLSNIVLIDVFHHLANPISFLKEAARVLKEKGRIIMIEPFPSFFSLLVYKKFHPEPFLMNKNYFGSRITEDKNPWQANQAIPYLIFFKYQHKFQSLFKNKLKIIKKEKFSFLLYPLSGGLEHPQLLPDFLYPLLKFMERYFFLLKNFMAFRCYIVLEKI